MTEEHTRTSLNNLSIPVVRVGDEKAAAIAEQINLGRPLNGEIGKSYEYDRETGNVFVPTDESLKEFILGRYDKAFFPRAFATPHECDTLIASGLGTMMKRTGKNYLMKINLAALKSLERDDFEKRVCQFGEELQEKLTNMYLNLGYPPTERGRYLYQVASVLQAQFSDLISTGDSECVEGILWHELEHVAFHQGLQRLLMSGNVSPNRRELFQELNELNEINETQALFAGILRLQKGATHAFLLFHNQNQLNALASRDGDSKMRETIRGVLTEAINTERHMVSYLIAMYGAGICNENIETLQLIDKEKLQRIVSNPIQSDDISETILSDYTDRLLYDIAHDPHLILERIANMQKILLPIWSRKLSYAIQNLGLNNQKTVVS